MEGWRWWWNQKILNDLGGMIYDIHHEFRIFLGNYEVIDYKEELQMFRDKNEWKDYKAPEVYATEIPGQWTWKVENSLRENEISKSNLYNSPIAWKAVNIAWKVLSCFK